MKTPIASSDYHTAGEPFRIVESIPFEFEGDTVAERRANAMRGGDIDWLRQVLCLEPRGHADMYGGFITPPDDDGADFGVLFWHKDGFSTACGHGTIALGVWALQRGLVAPDPSGSTDVTVDVPSGRVTARVHTEGERVTAVDFINVPSYVLATDVPLATSRGEVSVDVSFGGAAYAQVDAATLGLEVAPENVTELIAIGREIKWALNDSEHARHPSDDRLSGIYGTIIHERLPPGADGEVRYRNITVFADGQVDRSPTGSGTAARVATLVASGELGDGGTFVNESVVGSAFTARIAERLEVEGRAAVVAEVRGTAYKTGEHRFEVDPHDPLVPGFVLR
ncbi:proline racemase family protein [Zhihengliuella salsuginis]|uniref:Trans-3-hydroxy-L-proline dehydratase n=1 Tax=Zhihengliuella salsuginis TaxID=578222 RepID=A0ABQ3G9R3_9MICC|nr:proline racemase family protein [Zhihengliuella salsuginis]GHC99054.1 trans-3-hydroxy-L-proline dehydratase [Zhihengliuella salsuginis]